MSLIEAKEYLKNKGFLDRVIILDKSSSTVELAAIALNCNTNSIAKTMAFSLQNKDILVLLSGDTKIDNSKFKNEFGEKAKMIKAEELNEKIGHEMGGVCPFGIKANVEVYLDESLKQEDIVYPACGSSNSAVKLTIEELEKCSQYIKWVNIGK